jgi:hypothetical protein
VNDHPAVEADHLTGDQVVGCVEVAQYLAQAADELAGTYEVS